MPPDSPAEQDARSALYERLHDSGDFVELRSRYRRFAIPATVGFLAWYLLYVLLSSYAPGLMGAKVVGNVNVALVLGLLQFASTFAIAYLYARHANKALDPLARRVDAAYREELGR